MTLTINDTTMTSNQTPHTARQAPGRQHGWEVSWLPGRVMDRNTAITAMILADTAAEGGLHEGCCPSLKIAMRAALRIPVWGCCKAPQPWWLRGLGGGGAGGCG
jgi:hypothetical protein